MALINRYFGRVGVLCGRKPFWNESVGSPAMSFRLPSHNFATRVETDALS
jgi:hypothetical protein